MDIHLSNHLENAFFYRQDNKIIEKQKMFREMDETKETLSAISGIKEDTVLQKLVDLCVRPETFISLCLVPLIEVAWADNIVTEEEQKVIIRAAREMGIRQGNIDYTLVEQWISKKPAPDLLLAWIEYIQQLCSQVSPEIKRIIKLDLLEHATAVANASGGILNLGIGNRIATSQAKMLSKLEAAFGD